MVREREREGEREKQNMGEKGTKSQLQWEMVQQASTVEWGTKAKGRRKE